MAFADLLIHHVDLQRVSYARDAKGKTTPTWATKLARIACRIQPLAARQRLEFSKLDILISHRMYAKTETSSVSGFVRLPQVILGTQDDHQRRSRIRFFNSGYVAGVKYRYFEILGAYDVDEWARFTTLDLFERQDAFWNE